MLRLAADGWTNADNLAEGAPLVFPRYASWDATSASLVVVAPGSGTWVWTVDGGWPAAPQVPWVDTPAVDRSSAMIATPLGVAIANTRNGSVSIFDGASWSPAVALVDEETGQPIGRTQWMGIVPHDDGFEVHALRLFTYQARELCTLPFSCPIYVPTATPTFSGRWRTTDGETFVSQGDLAERSALGAMTYDEDRGETLVAFGMAQASEVPLASVHVATAFTTLPISDPDGEGAPPGRLATAIAARPGADGHVVFSGTTSSVDWGAWQTRTLPEMTVAEVDEIVRYCLTLGLPPGCIEEQVADALPPADLDDTWRFAMSRERPAFLATIDVASALLPSSAVVDRVEVRAVAGGTGGDDLTDGVDLKLYRHGAWRTLVSDDAAADAPSPIDATVTVAATAEAWRREGDALTFAVAPLGDNGPAAASVALDSLTAHIVYRLTSP